MSKQDIRAGYQERRAEIAALLELIGPAVERHAQAAGQQGLDWTCLDEIAYVRASLLGVLTFLTGHDRAAAERLLAEHQRKENPDAAQRGN